MIDIPIATPAQVQELIQQQIVMKTQSAQLLKLLHRRISAALERGDTDLLKQLFDERRHILF